MPIWLLIIGLIIKYGPTILALLMEIWDLIKMQHGPVRMINEERFRGLLIQMKSDKMKATNSLYEFRDELKGIIKQG